AYLHLYYSADDGGDEPVAPPPEQPPSTGRPARRPRAVERASDLAGLLIVPARTPTLDQELVERGLSWKDLGRGYAELVGGLFRLFVAEIDVVAEAEGDDVLSCFCHKPRRTLEAMRFMAEVVGTTEAMMAIHDLEDYDDLVRRF